MMFENIDFVEVISHFAAAAISGWCFGAGQLYFQRFLESSID
jgi:hypothetical protein